MFECEACEEGDHEECYEPTVVDPPAYNSPDGLGTIRECCCGALRDERP